MWSLFLPTKDSPGTDFPQSPLSENCSGILCSQQVIEEDSNPNLLGHVWNPYVSCSLNCLWDCLAILSTTDERIVPSYL